MRRPWPTSTPPRWRRPRARSSTRRRRSSRRRPAPGGPKCLARCEEVAAGEDGEDALPVVERGLRHRRARREPRRGDEDVQPAVGEHGAPGHLLTRPQGHIHLDSESATGSVGRLDLVGDLLRSICMQISDDDVRSERGELPCRCTPDAAPAAGDTATRPASSPPGRRLRELVALERPVLDRERLRFRERAEPAERLGGVLDSDRPVIEVAGQACARGIAPARDDADAGDDGDAGSGRDRSGTDASRRRGFVRSTRGTTPNSGRRRRGTPRRERVRRRTPGRRRRRAACAWCESGDQGTGLRPG